jgi:hypothetical protein
MYTTRTDLDGMRLVEPGKPDVWLMFHGKRHRVVSAEVYDALFSDVEALIFNDDVQSITMGPELAPGTCLVRPKGLSSIFLVTGRGSLVEKYYIPTYESFITFGFNMDTVVDVPPILLDAVALSGELTSSLDSKR